jgi:hypothetical protein
MGRLIVGLHFLESDFAARPGEPCNDLMNRSQFNLFYDIGVHLFGRSSGQAMDFATSFFERHLPHSPTLVPANPQKYFGFRTLF